jgi:hypothetical protein
MHLAGLLLINKKISGTNYGEWTGCLLKKRRNPHEV